MGRISGKITVKNILCKNNCSCGYISKKIFLEDNKTLYNFNKTSEITYNFEDIPYISYLKISIWKSNKKCKSIYIKNYG